MVRGVGVGVDHTSCILWFNIHAVKLPQILKIARAGSAQGLSYMATIFEMLAVTFTCTYNYAKGFPFRYPHLINHTLIPHPPFLSLLDHTLLLLDYTHFQGALIVAFLEHHGPPRPHPPLIMALLDHGPPRPHPSLIMALLDHALLHCAALGGRVSSLPFKW